MNKYSRETPYTRADGALVRRTKFLFDENDNVIGLIDDDGNIYTENLTPSSPTNVRYGAGGGILSVSDNESHLERLYAKERFDG